MTAHFVILSFPVTGSRSGSLLNLVCRASTTIFLSKMEIFILLFFHTALTCHLLWWILLTLQKVSKSFLQFLCWITPIGACLLPTMVRYCIWNLLENLIENLIWIYRLLRWELCLQEKSVPICHILVENSNIKCSS